MKRKEKNVRITINANVIVRNGVDVKEFIKKENEFIAEPLSVNGCITKIKIENVEEI